MIGIYIIIGLIILFEGLRLFRETTRFNWLDAKFFLIEKFIRDEEMKSKRAQDFLDAFQKVQCCQKTPEEAFDDMDDVKFVEALTGERMTKDEGEAKTRKKKIKTLEKPIKIVKKPKNA